MRMQNNFITTQLVANLALAEFSINCPFIVTGSRMYQKDFTSSGYKVGDTIQLRRRNQYIVGDGPTAVPQGIVQTVENLTVAHQYHTLIEYTIADLELRIEDFNQEFIQPAVQNIIGQLETDLALAAELQSYIFTGSASSAINSFGAVDLAGAKLLSQGVNLSKDAYVALSINDASLLKQGVQTNFTPVFNEKIVRNSAIGHISYFDAFQSQQIAAHYAGVGPVSHSGDTLLVNGAVGSGSTIVLSGATSPVANYFLPGDIISISGVQSVNNITKKSTGSNMQFVITAPANSSGSAITIQVSPAIISDSTNPQRNVSNAVPNGATVTTYGNHAVNLAYPMRGLDIVCPPLYKLQVPMVGTAVDPNTGLSLTITQVGDILNYVNYMRLDLLTGFVFHPQYVCRLISALPSG